MVPDAHEATFEVGSEVTEAEKDLVRVESRQVHTVE